jgi:hypothetical protein
LFSWVCWVSLFFPFWETKMNPIHLNARCNVFFFSHSGLGLFWGVEALRTSFSQDIHLISSPAFNIVQRDHYIRPFPHEIVSELVIDRRLLIMEFEMEIYILCKLPFDQLQMLFWAATDRYPSFSVSGISFVRVGQAVILGRFLNDNQNFVQNQKNGYWNAQIQCLVSGILFSRRSKPWISEPRITLDWDFDLRGM